MGGKASRDKGANFEREIVNWHRARSVPAERIPLSGAVKGNYAGDLKVGPTLGMVAECKRRARGFGALYAALEQDNSDILFVRDDRQPALVVMPMETYEAFMRWAGWLREEVVDAEA